MVLSLTYPRIQLAFDSELLPLSLSLILVSSLAWVWRSVCYCLRWIQNEVKECEKKLLLFPV